LNTELLISLIATLVGGSSSLVAAVLKTYLKKRKSAPSSEDMATQIKAISDSLSKSASDLVEMQEQLKERIAFVQDLNEQAKKAESIASLNQAQVDAVNAILGSNLQKEGRKGFWQGVVVNFVFFILGAVASYFMSVYLL